MIDPARAFAEQFTPVEGGYLYYPAPRSGAKLVTADEFEELAKAWRRRVGPWKIAGVGLVAIIIWTFVSDEVAMPKWSKSAFLGLLVSAICAWVFWAAYAPRRLVKDRPEVAPARPLKESRR